MDILGDGKKKPSNGDNFIRPKTIVVEETKGKELQWLQRCAVGTVKNVDFLPDLPFLLKEGGFLTMTTKYAGGLRYLLECDSAKATTQMLLDGKEALLLWFDWIKPWSRDLDWTSLGRLCSFHKCKSLCTYGTRTTSIKLQRYGGRLSRLKT